MAGDAMPASARSLLNTFIVKGDVQTDEVLGCVRVASFPRHERTLVLTQISAFRASTITFSYWLFVFFLRSLAKPPTRNKPLFSLAILV